MVKTSRLDSSKVLEFFIKKGTLTTQQVADHFKVSFQQAAAGISILRIKEVVEPASPAKTASGISRWTYVG